MKVIFPFAEHVPHLGLPIDNTLKSLPHSERRQILAHLLEPLSKLPVSEFIFILDCQSDQIRSYINANYNRIPVSFIEQTQNEGLGHTVSLASDYISDEPILIVVGDATLDMDWISFSQSEYSTIAVRRIVDKRPYGLVELREGMVGCLIQKPHTCQFSEKYVYF